ncbi:hypothetical protein FAI41_09045 [Acetobacteraceae bacterium]|nr:hypothetical protein FAI41_09045 [Acetobacteraceae bacterium]
MISKVQAGGFEYMLGIITGLRAEAKIARYFFPDALIVMSYSRHQGALEAIEYLKKKQVTHILSFGCAGALSSKMSVGDILVPRSIVVGEKRIETSKSLPWDISKAKSLSVPLLAVEKIIASTVEKEFLHQKTGAFSVDMESGVAATSGLPFSVLRVVCDEVTQILPPAALVPLNKRGAPSLRLILHSLWKNPSQISDLLKLGRNAYLAQKAMKEYLKRVCF